MCPSRLHNHLHFGLSFLAACVALLQLLLLVPSPSLALQQQPQPPKLQHQSLLDRRTVLQTAAAVASISGGFLTTIPGTASAAAAVEASYDGVSVPSIVAASSRTQSNSMIDFQAYQVFPDATASLSPSLVSMTVKCAFRFVCRRQTLRSFLCWQQTSFKTKLFVFVIAIEILQRDAFLDQVASSRGGALWLGEHHNAVADHNLQAAILEHLATQRLAGMGGDGPSMAVGLEQVQVKFQPFLDAYIAGTLSATELRQAVEWDQRWTWSFDGYEPVFRTAQQYGIPLLALNVNSEDLALVERHGLPGLPKDRLRAYIGDACVLFCCCCRCMPYFSIRCLLGSCQKLLLDSYISVALNSSLSTSSVILSQTRLCRVCQDAAISNVRRLRPTALVPAPSRHGVAEVSTFWRRAVAGRRNVVSQLFEWPHFVGRSHGMERLSVDPAESQWSRSWVGRS
jgi:Haem-binding uptake, Tiki superfamily, ChaN